MKYEILYVTFFICFISIPTTSALFGRNKKAEEEKKAEEAAKASLNAGMDALRETARDPRALKGALDALNDPETINEVKKMMADPAFKKQMDALMADPNMAAVKKNAQALMNDEDQLESLYSQMAKTQEAIQSRDNRPLDGRENAQLGMSQFSKMAADPRELAEAMEMLKDPEIQKEVEAMMKDPAFQAEMKRYTANPRFKQAMDTAAEKVNELAQDPARLESVKAQMEALMNN
eukprot:gene7192-14660_t